MPLEQQSQSFSKYPVFEEDVTGVGSTCIAGLQGDIRLPPSTTGIKVHSLKNVGMSNQRLDLPRRMQEVIGPSVGAACCTLGGRRPLLTKSPVLTNLHCLLRLRVVVPRDLESGCVTGGMAVTRSVATAMLIKRGYYLFSASIRKD